MQHQRDVSALLRPLFLTGSLLAATSLLVACGGGGDPASPSATPDVAALKVQNGKGKTHAWCDSSFDFSASALTAGWGTLQFNGAAGYGVPAINDGHLGGTPFGGAVLLPGEEAVPKNTKVLVMDYSANHPYSYWGSQSGFQVRTAAGANYVLHVVNAEYNFGLNNVQFRIDRVAGVIGQADYVGIVTTGSVVQPMVYGTQRIHLVLADGQAQWTMTSLSTGAVTSASIALPADLDLQDVVAVNTYSYSEGNWVDDLSITCASSRNAGR